MSDDGNQHIKLMEALGIREMKTFKSASRLAQTRVRVLVRQLYFDLEQSDTEDERVRDIHRVRAEALTAVLRMVLRADRREELIAEIERARPVSK